MGIRDQRCESSTEGARMGIRDQRLYIFLSDIFLSFLDRRQRDAIPSDAAADVSVNVNGHRPLQP